MKIVKSDISHLPSIAKVHRSAFPKNLSSLLGNNYLKKTLQWYLENHSNGFLIHLEDEGKIIGYVTAFRSSDNLRYGSASTLAQYAFREAVLAFFLRPWLLFHPEIVEKWTLIKKQFIIRSKLRQEKAISSSSVQLSRPKSKSNSCGLLSIGLLKEFQGKGCGSALLSAFEYEAVEKFNPEVLELSVKTNNKMAISAYLKNGWSIEYQDAKNTIMNKFL